MENPSHNDNEVNGMELQLASQEAGKLGSWEAAFRNALHLLLH